MNKVKGKKKTNQYFFLPSGHQGLWIGWVTSMLIVFARVCATQGLLGGKETGQLLQKRSNCPWILMFWYSFQGQLWIGLEINMLQEPPMSLYTSHNQKTFRAFPTPLLPSSPGLSKVVWLTAMTYHPHLLRPAALPPLGQKESIPSWEE